MCLTKHMPLFYCGKPCFHSSTNDRQQNGFRCQSSELGVEQGFHTLFFVGKLHKSGKEQGSNAHDVLRSLVQTLQAVR